MHPAMSLLLSVACCGSAQAQSMSFVMQAFPPFAIQREGATAGIFPEVIEAVCAAMRVQCTQRILPWRRSLRMAELGEADGIAAITRLPEREAYLYVTEALVQSSYGVFTRADNGLVYTAPADLEGYVVGAYGPSATSLAGYEVARAARSISLELEIDNATVLRKLSASHYRWPSAGILNADVGNYLIRQAGWQNVRLAGEVKKVEYSIGLSRQKLSPQQAADFQAALHELIRNGTVRTIVERHGLKPPLRGPPAQTTLAAR